MVRVDCVNFDIQPELGALRFDDVNIGPMDWDARCPRQVGHLRLVGFGLG